MFSYANSVVLVSVILLLTQSSSGQSFTFHFDQVNPPGVFSDSVGSTPVGVWDDLDIDGESSGSLVFEAFPNGRLSEVKLGSSSVLNWVSTGLGIGSSSDIESEADGPEFVSFVFDKPVTLEYLDLVSFSLGGNDALDVFVNDSFADNYSATKLDGLREDEWSPNIWVPANQELRLAHAGGSFLIQKMTVSVVPEPSTLIGFGLAGGLAFYVRSRRFAGKRSALASLQDSGR